MIGIRALFILLLYLLPAGDTCAEVNYKPGDWISYSTFRFVRGMASDQRHIYFATTGGLSRYNLVADKWATPLTTSNGLADNNVFVVAVDPVYLHVWCATREGVSRYDPGAEYWTTHLSGGGRFLTDVHSIGVTEDRRLFFESATGTAVYNLMNNQWDTPFTGGELSERQTGFIEWYGARARRPYTYPLFNTDLDYVFNPPEAISDKRAFVFPITGFREDRYANVWISTWGLNVGQGSLRTLQMDVHKFGLAGRNVTAMLKVGEEIWFGSHLPPVEYGPISTFRTIRETGGISRYNTGTGDWNYFFAEDTDGLSSGAVTVMTADSSEVWIGTDRGVAYYDLDEDIWTSLPLPSLNSPGITALSLSPSTLWIGSRAGLYRMDRLNQQIVPVLQPPLRDIRIHDIAMGPRNSVWLATDNGVYRRNTVGKWQKIERPDATSLNGRVLYIAMDTHDIWFGTSAALLKYNRETGTWKSFSMPLSVKDGHMQISTTPAQVWVGAITGAARFEKSTEKWLVYSTRDGLINDAVQALLPSGDHIWFGTPAGVTRFYWNDPSRVE